MRHANFDRIAWMYDALARLVFGRAIDQSQQALTDFVPASGHLLVLGGGTGRLLPMLWRTSPNIHITYIDASGEMIRRAKARQSQGQHIEFIHGTEADIPEGKANAVITPFYLDMFEGERLDKVVRKIDSHLAEDGQWLVAEFKDAGRWWQRLLLRIMYGFFRWSTGISAARLADYEQVLAGCGWLKIEAFVYYGGFVEAARFVRQR